MDSQQGDDVGRKRLLIKLGWGIGITLLVILVVLHLTGFIPRHG